jgi:NAD(P)-dependent dehydrogenase (short-subunit alcohol dehydrogenase family)
MALDGKHVLITGSSRGIGRGIALKLAESGVKVAIHYYQNEAAAKDTLAEVRKRGSDGFLVQADVSRPEQIAQMFRKVHGEFGKLDIFVSNARPDLPGFYRRPLDIALEQWQMALDSLRPGRSCWEPRNHPASCPMGAGSLPLLIALAVARGAGNRGLPWVPPRQRWTR